MSAFGSAKRQLPQIRTGTRAEIRAEISAETTTTNLPEMTTVRAAAAIWRPGGLAASITKLKRS